MEVSSFVRKDFYIQPPEKNASPDQWNEWLKADSRKARAAKAAHTRKQGYADAGDGMQETATRKIGGVWKQCLSLGFVGDAENIQAEPAIEADQDYVLARAQMMANYRKPKSKAKKARQRANRKARKTGKR